MSLRLFILLFCGLGFGCTPASDAPRLDNEGWRAVFEEANKRVAEQRADILLAGDSIMQFWPQPSELVRHTPWAGKTIVNAGINGETLPQLLYRVRHGHVAERAPSLLLLCVGTNDFSKGRSVDQMLAQSEELLEEMLARNDELVIVSFGVLPRHDAYAVEHKIEQKIRLYNAQLAAYAERQERVFYVDSRSFFYQGGQLKKGLFSDGIHLTEQAYADFTEYLSPLLERALGSHRLY